MIDPRIIRERPDDVRALLRDRRATIAADELFGADAARRDVQTAADGLRARKNAAAQEYGKLKKAGRGEGPEGAALMDAMKAIEAELSGMETRQSAAESAYASLALRVPNLPAADVPVGGEEAGVELKRWGTPGTFDPPAKPHWEIAEALGILDFERAAKIAGSRFALFIGAGARLERALIQFMLDLHTREHGYVEVSPPFLAKPESAEAAGHLPLFEDEMYRTREPDVFYLNPTAEVTLANIHRDEILDEGALPIKYVAYSPSFRREAGSYGKDVRGLIRQHQFDKVEMFLFTRPEDSIPLQEAMTGHAEAVLRALDLPYRVVRLATGDMSLASMRTHDLEVWLPGQGAYREISSCSTCGDFQARRARIRFRRGGKGKPELVHTLNGSGLAVGRTFVAILENHQNRDGSVSIPGVLRPYMGGLEAIRPAR